MTRNAQTNNGGEVSTEAAKVAGCRCGERDERILGRSYSYTATNKVAYFFHTIVQARKYHNMTIMPPGLELHCFGYRGVLEYAPPLTQDDLTLMLQPVRMAFVKGGAYFGTVAPRD